MKDPTANAAARNMTGQQRAARLEYMEDGVVQRMWLDQATLRRFWASTVVLTDDQGERHVRYPEVTQ